VKNGHHIWETKATYPGHSQLHPMFQKITRHFEFAAYSHILMQSLRTLVPRAFILPTLPFNPQTAPTVPCCRSNELYVAIVLTTFRAISELVSHSNSGRPSGVSNRLIITIDLQCVHPPIGLASKIILA
jgi:hypothetical protein